MILQRLPKQIQMQTKFLLRFDDISPAMAWSRFIPLKERLEELSVFSVLGVVPSCDDMNLMVEPSRDDFFDYVRHWAKYGDTIAQHGTHHVYDSVHSGLLNINDRSEFAGHPLNFQLERIRAGKNILVKEGVWQPYFMAPAHSFDENTLIALSSLDFLAVTDGFGFFPYRLKSIVLVPQLTSFSINVGFGYSTICIHINSLSQHQIERLLIFVKKNKRHFVNFKDVAKEPLSNAIFQNVTRSASMLLLRGYRRTRRAASSLRMK